MSNYYTESQVNCWSSLFHRPPIYNALIKLFIQMCIVLFFIFFVIASHWSDFLSTMKSYCKKAAAIRGFLHNVSVHLISLRVVRWFMRSLLCSLKIQTCRHDVEMWGARLNSQTHGQTVWKWLAIASWLISLCCQLLVLSPVTDLF